MSRLSRHENRALRAVTRAALARLPSGRDPDDLVAPRLTKVGRHFHDKLSPPERWLASQVGRPWDLIRSELVRRFDTRTTAGRHIVFDHMLPWVDEDDACGYRYTFAVDDRGVLRVYFRQFERRRPEREPLPRPEHELGAWLNGRRVGTRGDVLFWFTPSPTGGYRQHHRLDDADAALWRSLPDWFRACHDSFAPRPNTERRS